MTKRCDKLLLLFITLMILAKKCNAAVCVEASAGEDTPECLTGNHTNVCCKTLMYPLQQLATLTKADNSIYLMSNVLLNEVIAIQHVQNFVIEGIDTLKSISCSNTRPAGIFIHDGSNIVLSNIIIEGCSMLQNSSTSNLDNPEQNEPILCAVFIVNCTNLTLDRVTIRRSRGTGMVLYDTKGDVMIKGSNFQENVVDQHSLKYAGGGGLVMELTACELMYSTCNTEFEITDAVYTIMNSNFVGNSAHQHHPKRISHNLKSKNSYAGLGRGAGLFISVRGQANGNTFVIRNCTIVNNTAGTFGGGMYLSLGQGNSFNNSVDIHNCDFVNNICIHFGGGGLFLSLFTYTVAVPASNTVLMDRANFTGNTARIGGGLSILVQRGIETTNTLVFTGSVWLRNSAELGSAVDISPNFFDKAFDAIGDGILPDIKFYDCKFVQNSVTTRKKQSGEGFQEGLATFIVTNFVVSFGGSIQFSSNKGTGLYLIAGVASVLSNSTLRFTENTAPYGGGMVFHGFSVIYMSTDSAIHFERNEADTKGGAMFVESTDLHEQVYSRTCFLETLNSTNKTHNKNVAVSFDGNKVKSGEGNSIYASSLLPCVASCGNRQKNVTSGKDLDCLANISGLYDCDIRTDALTFQVDRERLMVDKVIPGKGFSIPIKAFDELNHSLSVHYRASLKSNNSIKQDERAGFGLYGMNSNMTLYNSKEQIESNTLRLRRKQTILEINTTLIKCPPGHVLDKRGECTCEVSQFQGIRRCDRNNKTAYLSPGYWFGLCGNEQCAGTCAPGFCRDKASIPLTERIGDIHKLICRNNREGKLCGRCAVNHSVYYHSDSYRCGKEVYCGYGILFYVLSEILPLTVIFVGVIAFNINFTTGSLNGIIFFAQVYDILIIYSSELFPKAVSTLFQVSRFFYSLVSLNYFNTEKMSFCLWKGATTLQIISWKYITIAYALCLIFISVRVLNTTRCKQICIWWRPHKLKNAIIHGFAAFLVMSYSQCAKVSFQVLAIGTLSRHDLGVSERAVWYSGENSFFRKAHIIYALPASIFMLVIVILPPLSLILYPAGFKILALCKLSELKIVNLVSRHIPVELFDSFQSCFKDNCRFMSGFYFLYRIIPLFLLAVTELVFFYFMVEILLILMLALHCFLQPYKKSLHNRIDCFVFTSLAIINGISFFVYMANSEGIRRVRGIKEIGKVAACIQLILISLPLVCVLLYAFVYIAKKLKKKRRSSDLDTTLLDSMYLPPLRDESESDDHEFHKMD